MLKQLPGTFLLIGINVLVFAVMAVQQGSILFDRPEDFVAMLWGGAILNPLVVGGDYWRLFSSMFMHWGIIHLAVNMYAFYGLGKVLEPHFGTINLILLYLITGVVGGIASLIFNIYVVSAGASGAIFGIYGYVIVRQAMVSFRDSKVLQNVLINFIVFVVINYLISKSLNVDTAAHIGGFISGALLSVIHYFNQLRSPFAMAVVAGLSPFLVFVVPKDQLNYYNSFQAVIKAERHLNVIYNESLSDNQFADSLRVVISAFDSAQVMLQNIPHVPEELMRDTFIIRTYAYLRKEEANFQLSMVEQESYIYMDSIEIVKEKLDTLSKLRFYPNYSRSVSDNIENDTSQSDTPQLELIKVWYDSVWHETENIGEAQYYRFGKRDSLNRWQGSVRDFYLNGEVQMKGAYKDGMRHGVFRYYSEHNTYESLGRYMDDRAVGRWESYHQNGLLQSEVFYNNGAYTKSIWDSLGNQQVTNGNGRQITWHANGQIAEEGDYVKGLKQGYWYGYYPSGKQHYQEMYRDDRLVRGVALNERGERFVYDQLSIFPFPEMGLKAYNEYLISNLQKTDAMEFKNGKVKINFSVDRDGTLHDFVVTQSVCIPCDQEAIRLVKEGPPWRPGVMRGHIKIRSSGYVEVEF